MAEKQFWRTKKFIELRNRWYKKLSNHSFHDLEWHDKNSGDGQNSPFLRNSLNKFKRLTLQQLSQTSEYFIDAQAFALHHKFPTIRHKLIWQMFSEGLSYRNMIDKLTEENFPRVPSVFWISTHLNKMKREFWIWQSKQPRDPDSLADFMEENRCEDL